MTSVVQFWTESGFTLWSRNARDIVTARGLDEFEAARALAAFSVATGDAMLACFESKYAHNFWRPWQAIQRADAGRKSPHASRPGVDAGGPCQPPRVPGRSRVLRRLGHQGARTLVRRLPGHPDEHRRPGRRMAGGCERELRLTRRDQRRQRGRACVGWPPLAHDHGALLQVVREGRKECGVRRVRSSSATRAGWIATTIESGAGGRRRHKCGTRVCAVGGKNTFLGAVCAPRTLKRPAHAKTLLSQSRPDGTSLARQRSAARVLAKATACQHAWDATNS